MKHGKGRFENITFGNGGHTTNVIGSSPDSIEWNRLIMNVELPFDLETIKSMYVKYVGMEVSTEKAQDTLDKLIGLWSANLIEDMKWIEEEYEEE